jgi:hypothetical protein
VKNTPLLGVTRILSRKKSLPTGSVPGVIFADLNIYITFSAKINVLAAKTDPIRDPGQQDFVIG